MVSIPRDSWVDIPGHGMNKINAAYGLGGPKLMVQTVEQATGLNVNDYVEVNFLAFVKVIDALGGVNICLPTALNDPESGIHMPACSTTCNGITALKYARDRHSFPNEDLTRIQDQQSLIATAFTKISARETLTNPLRLARLLGTVLPALRVDKGLNISALADQMRGINPHHVVFVTVPLANANYLTPTGQDAVQWNSTQADRLFGEISGDQPVIKPAPKPHRSGSSGHGLAHQAGEARITRRAGCRQARGPPPRPRASDRRRTRSGRPPGAVSPGPAGPAQSSPPSVAGAP